MKATATLETVIDRVHQMSVNQYDEIVPVQDMEFDSLNQMWISGRRVEILPSAQRLLSNRLRVPYSYLSRCPVELQARNLNYWIEQERQQRDTFFCRFDGNRLRAVFTERYRPLDNMEILSQLIQHGFDPSTPVQYAIDDGMFLVKIPEYARAFGVNPGYGQLDEIVPGVAFSNSETGLIAFSIEAFFYRLVCTNGLIAKTSSTVSRFKHISNRGLENFPETLAGVIEDSISQAGTVQAVPASQPWTIQSGPSRRSASGSVYPKRKRRWCGSPITWNREPRCFTSSMLSRGPLRTPAWTPSRPIGWNQRAGRF